MTVSDLLSEYRWEWLALTMAFAFALGVGYVLWKHQRAKIEPTMIQQLAALYKIKNEDIR